MTAGYLSEINYANIVDCEPYKSSLFESTEQSFLLVVEINETLKKLKISEREKDIIVTQFKQGDEVVIVEERLGDVVSVDVIQDNRSLLKNDIDNVIRVNHVFEDSDHLFDSEEYEALYNAFEYTYERMTEVSKENVETLYLYFNALSQFKNGQTAMSGTETLIKQSISYGLQQDIAFDSLIDLFDLENEHNIKTIINSADDPTKAPFFKTLVDTKTKLNVSESQMFRCFKDLNMQ